MTCFIVFYILPVLKTFLICRHCHYGNNLLRNTPLHAQKLSESYIHILKKKHIYWVQLDKFVFYYRHP
jgi:hypothetical protein